MKFKIGDKVKSFFGDGVVLEFLEKENMILYKIELSHGEYKGKMPWFAEHELEKIIYEVPEEKIINPGFEGEEDYGKIQRKKNLEIALAINYLGSGKSSDYCNQLTNDYINGILSPEEITRMLIEKYKLADDC